jgi:alpha-glucuronidase
MTWSNHSEVVKTIIEMMESSRETFVNYTCPLGLAGVFEKDLHYAPDPGMVDPRHEDWSAAYYVRADAKGLGFDRTRKGSKNVDQYHPPLNSRFNNLNTCPEEYLLWFHHVAWDQPMKSGGGFWDALCRHYGLGVHRVEEMEKQWGNLKGKVDEDLYRQVEDRLRLQVQDAKTWRDKCLKYFQTFSKRPFPTEDK